LAAALRRLAPEARLFGMGGERMASAGVELLADARDMAVVGFTEAVRRLPHLRHTLAEIRKALRSQRPDVLVTIDYPGFNLRRAAPTRGAASASPTAISSSACCPAVALRRSRD